jgi:hypothetical protein
MSTCPPGTFQFAERTMELSVGGALRQAESDRVRRLAKAGVAGPHRFYFGTLAWLDHLLATWGQGLQERYGSQGKRSMRRSAEGLAN